MLRNLCQVKADEGPESGACPVEEGSLQIRTPSEVKMSKSWYWVDTWLSKRHYLLLKNSRLRLLTRSRISPPIPNLAYFNSWTHLRVSLLFTL